MKIFVCFALLSLIVSLPDSRERIHENYGKESITPYDYLNIVIGLLRGLNLMDIFYDINDCLGNDKYEIIALFEQAIEYLQKFDLKHLNMIIDALDDIIKAVIMILKDLRPCAKDISELDFMIYQLEHENLTEIAIRIILHGGKMYEDLKDMPEHWKGHNYMGFGIDVGDLCYNLLLSAKS